MVNIRVITSRPNRLLHERRFRRAVRDGFRRGTSSTAANRKLLSMPSPRGESDDGLSSRDVSVAALIVSVEVPLLLRLAGLTEQVVALSPATLHERLMTPENPASVVTVIKSVPVPPPPIVRDGLLADKVKPWFTVTAAAAVWMMAPLVAATVTFPVNGVPEVAAIMVNTAMPLPFRLVGLIEHVVAPSDAATLHVRLTVSLKPPKATTLMASLPDPPLVIARVELLRFSVKSGFDAPFHAETSAETSTEPHPLATS